MRLSVVIFAARHGQGFHNVAESQYGTEKWDCYWFVRSAENHTIGAKWSAGRCLTAMEHFTGSICPFIEGGSV